MSSRRLGNGADYAFGVHMICADATLNDTLRVIRGEFLEMPGLLLTRSQFQRLWGLDARASDEAIDELLKSHFLVRRADGQYGRQHSDVA